MPTPTNDLSPEKFEEAATAYKFLMTIHVLLMHVIQWL